MNVTATPWRASRALALAALFVLTSPLGAATPGDPTPATATRGPMTAETLW